MEQSLSSIERTKTQPNEKSYGLGFVAAISAAICFSVMAILVNGLSGKINSSQVLTWRSVIVFVSLIPFTFKEVKVLFAKNAIPIWGRSICGVGGILCYFYLLQNMKAANAAMIYLLSPVFILILAKVFLKEKLSKKQTIGIAIILITEFAVKFSNFVPIENKLFLIGIGGALIGSAAMLLLKVSADKFSASLILTCFSFCTFLITGLMNIKNISFPSNDVLYLVFGVGLCTLVGHLLLTFSMKHMPASIPNFILKTIVIWIAIINIFAFQKMPTWQEATSYGILLIGVFFLKKESHS